MTDKMDNYRIVETLNDSQVSDLMDLYKNEFWSDKRTREDGERVTFATSINTQNKWGKGFELLLAK
ncbi:hypothetical protein QUA20_18540, partial [Microcoleus sp. Pol7_A1]